MCNTYENHSFACNLELMCLKCNLPSIQYFTSKTKKFIKRRKIHRHKFLPLLLLHRFILTIQIFKYEWLLKYILLVPINFTKYLT